MGEIDRIVTGRRALRRGDVPAAREAFGEAYDDAPGGVFEGLGEAAYLEQNFANAIEMWERAYAAYQREGNRLSAVRTARRLSYMYGAVVGDGAVMSGWNARARSLLGGDDESAEAGWIDLIKGMFAGEREIRDRAFRAAIRIADKHRDGNLRYAALAYLGANLVYSGRFEEGMVLLDEACAAVAGGDVDDFSCLEEIFCQTFSACEHAHDVVRADQWIRIGEEVAARRNLPAVSAFCRTHYGAILTTAGRWVEADEALTEAVRIWGLGYTSLRSGALIRLADLRVRQGRFEEAEQLLEGFDTYWEAARPLAAIHLARGNTDLALAVVERALDNIDGHGVSAAPLWSLLVDIHLARGAYEEASSAADEVARCADVHRSHYLRAAAALARGRVCLAAGDGDPRACLHEAIAGFAKAQTPMELALTRLELANAFADRPEVAVAEAKAALETFERMNAARLADAAAATLRRLGVASAGGPKGSSVLTRREEEVLELLGHGMSNPEIADRLFISRKTVEHHVGRILTKLGLRSRAEAAAYASRVGSSGTR